MRSHWEEGRDDQRQSELRHEKRARRRGHRARNHLARAQGDRGSSLPRLPEGRASRALLFALSLGLGALSASWLSQAWLDWSESEMSTAPAISIQGATRLRAEAVAASVHWKGSSETIEAQLEAHPWIREAQALRLPTGVWLVRVHEREPLYRLAGERQELVDREGVVFAEADERDATLPLLRLAPESDRAESLREALGLLEALDSRRIRRSLEASGYPLELAQSASRRGWVLRAPRYGLDIVLGESRPAARLEQLERLLGSSLAAELPGKEIDLRFAERAIVRNAEAWPEVAKESSPASG